MYGIYLFNSNEVLFANSFTYFFIYSSTFNYNFAFYYYKLTPKYTKFCIDFYSLVSKKSVNFFLFSSFNYKDRIAIIINLFFKFYKTFSLYNFNNSLSNMSFSFILYPF